MLQWCILYMDVSKFSFIFFFFFFFYFIFYFCQIGHYLKYIYFPFPIFYFRYYYCLFYILFRFYLYRSFIPAVAAQYFWLFRVDPGRFIFVIYIFIWSYRLWLLSVTVCIAFTILVNCLYR